MSKINISWKKNNLKTNTTNTDMDILESGERLIGVTDSYDFMKFYITKIKDHFELSTQSTAAFSDLKFHDDIVEHWGRHGTIKQCKIHALRLVNQFSKNKSSKKQSKILRGI